METTVEVIIRLPKFDYDYILSQGDTRRTPHLAEAICNGTILPKGHGRLIDESIITEVYTCKTEPEEINGIQTYPRIEIIGTNAPTIIEADTESEE